MGSNRLTATAPMSAGSPPVAAAPPVAGITRALVGTPRSLAVARIAFGAVVLARPAMLARGMRVDSATARRTTWLARMFASREIALGAATLLALRGDGNHRPWLAANAAIDALDAAALLVAARQRQAGAAAAIAGAAGAAASTVTHLARWRHG